MYFPGFVQQLHKKITTVLPCICIIKLIHGFSVKFAEYGVGVDLTNNTEN